MLDIFIIGSKGIPAHYGGFETFADNLVTHKQSPSIRYHVSCLGDDNREFTYNEAHCFTIKKNKYIGPANAIFYDLASLDYCIKYIKEHQLKKTIVYILGGSIGPFLSHYTKKLHDLDCVVYFNPDGLEWMRDKWSLPVKKYLKLSEKDMIKHSDVIVCDSLRIKTYVDDTYSAYQPNTHFIPYGASYIKQLDSKQKNDYTQWLAEHNIEQNDYYLTVGRLIPENNFYTILTEFMASSSKKQLVCITDTTTSKYYDFLLKSTHFDTDKRIHFVGSVYDAALLTQIRKGAFAYIHAHQVGGTNPSLVEALASTSINILLGVDFNKEVGQQCAFYFTKKPNSLKSIVNKVETLTPQEQNKLGEMARQRIEDAYTWPKVICEYEQLFSEKT